MGSAQQQKTSGFATGYCCLLSQQVMQLFGHLLAGDLARIGGQAEAEGVTDARTGSHRGMSSDNSCMKSGASGCSSSYFQLTLEFRGGGILNHSPTFHVNTASADTFPKKKKRLLEKRYRHSSSLPAHTRKWQRITANMTLKTAAGVGFKGLDSVA